MKFHNIALIGLGAVGCSYAALMHRSGLNLRIIADEARKARYEDKGVTVNGQPIRFSCLLPGESFPADVLFVATKFHHLPQVVNDIRGCVGKNTVIVSMLNGLGAEQILSSAYPDNPVLYCRVAGLAVVRTGDDLNLGNLGMWKMGAADNTVWSEPVAALAALCDAISMPYEVPADMLHAVWWKLMANVGINQCSCILRAPYGVFQTNRDARNMMLTAMEEVRAVAPSAGVTLTDEDVKQWCDMLDGLTPWGKTSMLQDIEAGRKTEVEVLAGSVIRAGEKLGVPTPVNAFLLDQIHAMEAMNAAAKAGSN